MNERMNKNKIISDTANMLAYMCGGAAVANVFYDNEFVRQIVFFGIIVVLMLLLLATQKSETAIIDEYNKIIIQKLKFEMLPMQFFTALEKSKFDEEQREEIYKIFYGEYLEVFEHGTNDKDIDE